MKTRPATLWVHRLSSNDAGQPVGAIAEDDVESGLVSVAREILRGAQELLPFDAVGEQRFLNSELLEHGRLRQGWGFPGFDLRRESTFLHNFVIAKRKFWNSVPDEVREQLRTSLEKNDPHELFALLSAFYREASGRFAILCRMIRMNRGDIVFIPNVPSHGRTFSVCRIADAGYVFEERTGRATFSWERDFGHLREVEDIQTFEYGPKTLLQRAFGAPYRHAIDGVSSRREEFERFIREQYRSRGR